MQQTNRKTSSNKKSNNPKKTLKRMKQISQDCEGQLPMIINNFPGRIALIDKDFRYRFINDQYEKVYGLTPDKVLGHTVAEVFGEAIFHKVKPFMQRALGGEMVTIETEVKALAKETIHGLNIYMPDFGKDTNIIGLIAIIMDITERKKKEMLFDDVQTKFKIIFDAASDGMLLARNNDGKFFSVNKKICEMTGYTEQELLKLSISDIHPVDQLPYVFDQVKKLISREISYVSDLPVQKKDKSLFYVDISVAPVTLSGEKYLIGLFRDIMERKKVEEKLYQSETKYRTVLEDIKEGYFEVDLAGNFTFFNDTICRVLGYSREELMGMNNRHYTDQEELKKVYLAYNSIYKTGEPVKDLNWQITRKDGTKRHIEGFISLRKDSAGKPIGFRGIAHDVTERRQIEERLRNEEERFKTLADQSSDIIILIDNQGTITYENQASQILGIKAQERIGKNVLDRLHPDDWQLVMNAFNILFGSIKAPVQKGEIRLRHEDGSWRTFEVIGSNLVRNHVIEAAMINLRDITDRKKSENLIRESEEKYRLLADHMKDQVWLMDMKMDVTYASPSVERLTGYSLDELKQMTWGKILTPESLRQATDFISKELPRALKAHSDYLLFKTLELEFVLRNGKTIWGECAFSLIRDETGKAVSILGEARNITERKLAEEKLQQTLDSLKRAVGTTIQVLVSALESRDPYTAGHQLRSANLACAIAMELGLSHDRIEGIRMAGNIHDIGKLSVPAEILSKPTKLTGLEFSLVKEHASCGYEMLKYVESPWPLAQIVHQHHERVNGTGYPNNLKGDDIIIEARIMAVADVVEAMASHRPYRPSLGIDAALGEIEKNKGILYDEKVVDACLKLFREKKFNLELT